MNYYSPQIIDSNILISGFDNIWFITRSFMNNKRYDLKKNKSFDEKTIIRDIVDNKDELVYKFDDNNYLTNNLFPYNLPINSKQYLFWTFKDKTHQDILNYLKQINIINKLTDYMIWINTDIWSSIKSVKHFHILIRPIKFNPVYSLNLKQCLHKMMIIARHGPREPILVLPNLKPFTTNDNRSVYQLIYEANLTDHGANYCMKFGKFIKEIYSPWIKFNKDKSLFLDSGFKRTRDSSINFYSGLLLDKEDKSYFKEAKELIGDLDIHNLNNDINFDDIDRKIIDEQIFEILGYKIQKPEDYFYVMSTLDVYKEHSIELPLELTKEIIKNITDLANEYYYRLFKNIKFCKKFLKSLRKLILDILLNPDINFSYLSTHDIIIYPLVMYIYKERIKLPYYCSNVRFELWTNEIRIYYDDNLIYNNYTTL